MTARVLVRRSTAVGDGVEIAIWPQRDVVVRWNLEMVAHPEHTEIPDGAIATFEADLARALYDALHEHFYGPRPRADEERDRGESQLYEMGELRDTGLLWLINASVFHPRGLALAFHYKGYGQDQGKPIGWSLLAAGPGEAYQFAPGPEIDELYRTAELTLDLARSSEARRG